MNHFYYSYYKIHKCRTRRLRRSVSYQRSHKRVRFLRFIHHHQTRVIVIIFSTEDVIVNRARARESVNEACGMDNDDADGSLKNCEAFHSHLNIYRVRTQKTSMSSASVRATQDAKPHSLQLASVPGPYC